MPRTLALPRLPWPRRRAPALTAGTGRATAALLLVAALAATLHPLVGAGTLLTLLTAALWFVLPGVAFTRALYQREWTWGSALAAPAAGYGASSLALLALWALGMRSAWTLAAAPLLALPVAWAAGRVAAGRISTARFGAGDLIPLALALLLVPVIVALPYAHVGADMAEGRAYRAYFTADFVWAVTVVAEIAKGHALPQNPFLAGEGLHYYWLPHLFPGLEHRVLPSIPLERLLLVNAVFAGLAFVGFLYFLARHATPRPAVAAWSVAATIVCTSFEGLHELVAHWRAHATLAHLRDLNIDAISRWVYHSLPVDGLQRLLLYQPQHQLGYVLGFLALLVLGRRRAMHPGPTLLAGLLLGGAVLFSSFAALMLSVVASLLLLGSLRHTGSARTTALHVLALSAPVAAAAALAATLHYVDGGWSLIQFGLNPLAVTRWPVAMMLSFGPMVVAVPAAAYLAATRRQGTPVVMPLAVVAVSLAAYFLVDVVDHQHVYVGWRAGHLIFIACAPLVAYVLNTALDASAIPRRTALGTALLLGLAALPTPLIDIYNTQDISNRDQGPGFHWTLVLTPDEQEALSWIRRATPPDARVQVEPTVRGSESWAYIPAFAERRMAAGLPISMVPFKPYQDASERIRRVYRAADAATLQNDARRQQIDYVVVAPPERAAYPHAEQVLLSDPIRFTPVFGNASVRIFHVNPPPV